MNVRMKPFYMDENQCMQMLNLLSPDLEQMQEGHLLLFLKNFL